MTLDLTGIGEEIVLPTYLCLHIINLNHQLKSHLLGIYGYDGVLKRS